MSGQLFKSAILISLLSHIVIIGIFSLSFGNKMHKENYSMVAFLGAVLSANDIVGSVGKTINLNINDHFISNKNKLNFINQAADYPLASPHYIKPQVLLTPYSGKVDLSQGKSIELSLPKRKEPVIMFYPQLPYNFLLYFKDRQEVHIELMFKIAPTTGANSVVIKRKISSGNLEADLLSMRYIDHYLSVQQARFSPDTWQNVKIDLRPKNE